MNLPPSVIMSDRIWGSIYIMLGILILVYFRKILALTIPKKENGTNWRARIINNRVDRYNASPLYRVYDRASRFIAFGLLAVICIDVGLRTLLLMNEPPIRDSIWLPH